MTRRKLVWGGLAVVVGCIASCSADEGNALDDTPVEDAVTVDTSSPAARAQYDANVAFALGYRARCVPRAGRKRVLITGFGRFLDNPVNATGKIVSALVPEARYPQTTRPPKGTVDLPAPQTSVARGTITLPRAGEVDVCAMVLPVYWDLAAILTLKEVEAFGPDLVLMNGIAGPEQDLWIELGSVNRAMTLRDGSDLLEPVVAPDRAFAPIVPAASQADTLRGMLLSWSSVRDAARAEIARQSSVTEGGRPLGDILGGARLAGFPRDGNTYLCNNITYAVNYAMSYPGRTLTLLQASVPVRGATNRVTVKLTRDARAVPRVFMHWPSRLAGAHLGAAAGVMRAVLDAQLTASRTGAEAPTRGTNDRAELAATGSTF
jgi:pyrrolidone-carboxylate peptidase